MSLFIRAVYGNRLVGVRLQNDRADKYLPVFGRSVKIYSSVSLSLYPAIIVETDPVQPVCVLCSEPVRVFFSGIVRFLSITA